MSIPESSLLWAKNNPYHPLLCHMVDVGCMSQVLLTDSIYSCLLPYLSAKLNLPEEILFKHIGCLFALHDIGKCHPLFQQKALDLEVVKALNQEGRLQIGDTRAYFHEWTSANIVKDLLSSNYKWQRPNIRLWSEVISGHHQRFGLLRGIDKKNEEFWLGLQSDLSQAVISLFDADFSMESRCNHRDLAGTLLEGLLVISDWIVSNNEIFGIPVFNPDDMYEYKIASTEQALQTIKLLGLSSRMDWKEKTSFSDVWPNIPVAGIRALQHGCADLVADGLTPGLLFIEAPMGEGKTEAAIYVATQWIRQADLSGIYMALPTAATSNQMFRRIDDFLSMHDIETPVRLLHSTAWLVDKFSPARDPELDADGELARQWFEPQRRGLLSPWAVGTVDQAMMAALKIKYQFLRLLGLSSKVLIIDEAHAYDVYMTTILERLLSWCSVLQIPVIILSATLPADKRRSLMQAYAGHITAPGLVSSGKDYPQLTHVDLSGNITERTICTVHGQNVVDVDIWPGALGDWERVADRAVLMAGKGGCICVIVNTVKEAQQLYKMVSERADETIWVRLFHSRYCVGDRLEIERVCLKAFGKTSLLAEQRGGNSSRPAKAILIATQVVEQSLDLDFDAMITALAPIDLILQRMGRMHRHEGRKRPPDYAKPVLTVLSPHDGGDLGPSAYVYEPWLLRKTLEILRHYEHISTANDIRPLIEKVYSEIPAPNHQNYDDWAEMINKIEDDKNKARVYLLPQPNKDQFTLSMIQEKFADPEASSEWFRARTRQGDDNCQVILLDPADFSHIGDKAYMISLDQAKKIMLSMVNIPAYWLANTSPAEGFTAMVEGTGRLSGRNLLEIREGRWEGQDSSKRGVNLIYDKIFGARLERK